MCTCCCGPLQMLRNCLPRMPRRERFKVIPWHCVEGGGGGGDGGGGNAMLAVVVMRGGMP